MPVGPATSVWPTSPMCVTSRNGVAPSVRVTISGGPSRWSHCALAGPYRRHRHHVRQVQRRDDGLAHVGVGVARNRRQPRIHGVERFGDGDEAPALDDALHHAQLLVGHGGIGIEHGHRGGDVAEGDLIAAQLLQGRVRIGRLVAGVGIDQRAFLLEDRFAQQRDDVLALGEPLAAQAPQLPFRLGFVQAEKARAPAVGKAQAVEVVQNPRPGRGREAPHRHHAQVLVAQHGRQAADQRGIGQQRVDVERHFGHGHADSAASRWWRAGRSASGVIEPGDFRHHAIEQVEDAIRFRHEGSSRSRQSTPSVGRFSYSSPAARARDSSGGRYTSVR
jgi:hypothetical protein